MEDLSPIGLNYLDDSNADAASIASASTRLRGRVFQVGELAGSAADSANKVITGVVDSSWTALRGLIIAQPVAVEGTDNEASTPSSSHPGMRARQASTFSLASVTASVASIAAAAAASTTAARTRSRANSRASAIVSEQQWGANQEMVEVASRPESIREQGVDLPSYLEESNAVDEEKDEDGQPDRGRRVSDTRSIRSVSLMMSPEGSKPKNEPKDRQSLGNRLVSIGVLGRLGTAEAGARGPPQDFPPTKVYTLSYWSTNEANGVSQQTGFLANLSGGRASSTNQTSRGRRGSLLSGINPDMSFRSKEEVNPSPSSSVTSLNMPPPPPPEPIEPPIERFMTCE